MFCRWLFVPIYNYGPLCRETSRFVNLRGKLFSRGLGNIQVCQPEGEVVFPRDCPRENSPSRVDKSGCFSTQRVVIVLLYFCQCFIGYPPCGGKLGCSAGNNRVVSSQHKFLPMFYRLSPLWGKIGLFGREQYTITDLCVDLTTWGIEPMIYALEESTLSITPPMQSLQWNPSITASQGTREMIVQDVGILRFYFS